MTESNVLEAEHLQKIYFEGPQEVQVLRDVNLSVQRGERLAIVGSSGSGKSTLLNLLGGLDTPTKGSVKVAGKELTTLDQNERGKLRNQYLGFVYQFHHLLGEFTALENVSMPLLIARQPTSKAKAQATELLERVGLGKRLDHKPSELSGGERQRVAIARAMVTQPACVLMDEPTGNLDQNTAQSIEALIQELNRELGLSFIIVSHDLTLAHSMDRVLELQQGSLHEASQKTTGVERNGSHQ